MAGNKRNAVMGRDQLREAMTALMDNGQTFTVRPRSWNEERGSDFWAIEGTYPMSAGGGHYECYSVEDVANVAARATRSLIHVTGKISVSGDKFVFHVPGYGYLRNENQEINWTAEQARAANQSGGVKIGYQRYKLTPPPDLFG